MGRTNTTARSAVQDSKTPKMVAARTVSGSAKSASSHPCQRRHKLLCLLKLSSMLVERPLLLIIVRLRYSSMDLTGNRCHVRSSTLTGKVLLPEQLMRQLPSRFRVPRLNILKAASTLQAILHQTHTLPILIAYLPTDAGGMMNHILPPLRRRTLLMQHS